MTNTWTKTKTKTKTKTRMSEDVGGVMSDHLEYSLDFGRGSWGF